MNEQQTHKAQTLEYHPNTTTLHKEETGKHCGGIKTSTLHSFAKQMKNPLHNTHTNSTHTTLYE
jgi:hypothetical protein